MMKFDLHMHTRKHSSDAVTDPFALIKRAKEIGLDGVVITEHDFLWTEEELNELREAQPDLVILAGVEVTARGGDMLCYGVTDPFAIPRGIEWPKLCREVHRQGGVCVVAHPYRWNQPIDTILREQKPEVDGIEMMSKNMDSDIRKKAEGLKSRNPLFAGLGNSDSHEVDTVGLCYTEFDAEIRTIQDIAQAIRERKTTPRIRET
jgi:predicted metal-dependent phosphoesterase TrpH